MSQALAARMPVDTPPGGGEEPKQREYLQQQATRHVGAFQLEMSVDQDLSVVAEAIDDDDVVMQWLVPIVFACSHQVVASSRAVPSADEKDGRLLESGELPRHVAEPQSPVSLHPLLPAVLSSPLI